ncbi:Threonine dehydrogenase [Abditibacterium utsteinense]|uniref:Threonine dehydrogenase n=1 Tax=Abditibacterium utsteinense TaxID=1960156 RepID=A0A2S8SP83_9BACT|nr:zinc-binding alcohol dehydrogenase [Abditibacterium utsteinense]PQV62601.1 Threonine dehydrogenase [Abditibacterium utsteinense]
MQSLNIRFVGKDQVEIVEELVPDLKSDQILVRSLKSLISTGTESICLGRKFAPGTGWESWLQYPFYPGYLCAGEILEVGSEVTTLKPGDRITSRGPHRQFFTMNAANALPIPDGASIEDAAWFGLAKITQNGVRKANHVMGDAVVVIGLGLLGQLVVQYARLMGAREVIAIDTAPLRLEMARAHGATHTLQMSVADAKEQVESLTDGRLADVVYDVTGHAAVFAPALGLARRFGTLLLLGDTGTPSEQRLTSDVVGRGVKIVGAHDVDTPWSSDCDYWTQSKMGGLFFSYLQRDQMRVSDLVTHRFSPRDAIKTYQLLEIDRASVMGVIFDWEQL